METKNSKAKNIKDQSGVALLFTILLTSVLLIVAIGIANISYKELTFSLEAKDSSKAFFAADTGVECAMYLDKLGVFSGTSTLPPACHGDPLTILTSGPTISQFIIPLTNCVHVTVDKDFIYDDGTGPSSYTQISSIGYNISATDPTSGECLSGAPGPRVVTRALLTRYPNDTTGGTTGTGGTGGTGMDGTTSPLITTVSATSLDPNTELLTGNLDDMGGATGMYVDFLYNEDATFTGGTYSTGTPLMTRTTTGPFSYTLTGLTCATTYDFEAWGNNTFVGMGSNMTFTTAPCL